MNNLTLKGLILILYYASNILNLLYLLNQSLLLLMYSKVLFFVSIVFLLKLPKNLLNFLIKIFDKLFLNFIKSSKGRLWNSINSLLYLYLKQFSSLFYPSHLSLGESNPSSIDFIKHQLTPNLILKLPNWSDLASAHKLSF